MTFSAFVFNHQDIDYCLVDRPCQDWREYRARLDKLPADDPRRAACQAALARARRAMDVAAVELDRQRKAQVEAWARRRGFRVNWSAWERQAA